MAIDPEIQKRFDKLEPEVIETYRTTGDKIKANKEKGFDNKYEGISPHERDFHLYVQDYLKGDKGLGSGHVSTKHKEFKEKEHNRQLLTDSFSNLPDNMKNDFRTYRDRIKQHGIGVLDTDEDKTYQALNKYLSGNMSLDDVKQHYKGLKEKNDNTQNSIKELRNKYLEGSITSDKYMKGKNDIIKGMKIDIEKEFPLSDYDRKYKKGDDISYAGQNHKIINVIPGHPFLMVQSEDGKKREIPVRDYENVNHIDTDPSIHSDEFKNELGKAIRKHNAKKNIEYEALNNDEPEEKKFSIDNLVHNGTSEDTPEAETETDDKEKNNSSESLPDEKHEKNVEELLHEKEKKNPFGFSDEELADVEGHLYRPGGSDLDEEDDSKKFYEDAVNNHMGEIKKNLYPDNEAYEPMMKKEDSKFVGKNYNNIHKRKTLNSEDIQSTINNFDNGDEIYPYKIAKKMGIAPNEYTNSVIKNHLIDNYSKELDPVNLLDDTVKEVSQLAGNNKNKTSKYGNTVADFKNMKKGFLMEFINKSIERETIFTPVVKRLLFHKKG